LSHIHSKCDAEKRSFPTCVIPSGAEGSAVCTRCDGLFPGNHSARL